MINQGSLEFLKRKDGNIAYQCWYTQDQKRSPILFLHDSLGCIELWRNFPEQISNITQRKCLAYDRYGYGKSSGFLCTRNADYLEQEAHLLIEFMDEWNIAKAILFGHSDGGSIALIAAAKYPERIDAIIVEGAHVFVEDITLQGIAEARNSYEQGHLHQRLVKYHGDKTRDLVYAWIEIWNSDSFKNWNLLDFLPQIQCPALVIQGEYDEFGSLRQVDAICEGIGAMSQSVIISQAKHSPHKENKLATLEAINDFHSRTFSALK